MTGFSLIMEKLVATCFVAILSCLAFSNFHDSISRARDAREMLDQRTFATEEFIMNRNAPPDGTATAGFQPASAPTNNTASAAGAYEAGNFPLNTGHGQAGSSIYEGYLALQRFQSTPYNETPQ